MSVVTDANIVTVEALRAAGYLRAVDVQLARTLGEIGAESHEWVHLAVALTFRYLADGHVCLPLDELVSRPLSDLLRAQSPDASEHTGAEPTEALTWPDPEKWLELLQASALSVPHNGPVVVEEPNVYLRRYYEHERDFAASIAQRLQPLPATSALATPGGPEDEAEQSATRALLDQLFPAAPTAASKPAVPDLQRAAAETVLGQRFTVITGGPGTGKTYTVVNVMVLLVAQAQRRGLPAPRMTLVAPTGKAAARLGESIRDGKARLRQKGIPEALLEPIPESPSTIHRALGVMGGDLQHLRHHAENPLATDVLLVDEASMVDLPLMRRLVSACPLQARLILLGDKDQLASVEAGAVLGQLSEASAGPLQASVVRLSQSYRFGDVPGIERLAEAVNAGDSARALQILDDPELSEVTLVDLPKAGLGDKLATQLLGESGLGAYLDAVAQRKDIVEVDEAFGNFRILCAVRKGHEGLAAVTNYVEDRLRTDGRVTPDGDAYMGRPILISKNDYGVSLFNGDTGLVLPDPDAAPDAPHRATFVDGDKPARRFALSRLPEHETAFAITVHKAQGSEATHIAIVLPREPSRVLTRELIYTAITRAKKSVTIYCDRETFRSSVESKMVRHGRLAERIMQQLSAVSAEDKS